ncbi:MAG: glycoside hydrolase family 36 protein [Candidatus Hodarchaeota archaeon]
MIEIINDNNDIIEVFNGIIGFKFNKSGENKGNYEIYFKKNGLDECIIKNCYSVINFYPQDKEDIIECASKSYIFESNTEKIANSSGDGLKVVFKSLSNVNQEISFKIQFTLYENKDFLLIKLIDIIDNSLNQLAVHSISPLTIKNSFLWLSGLDHPTNLHNITWFKHGWQSWSYSKLIFGNEEDTKGPEREIFKMVYDNQDYKIEGRFYSEYCTVITDLQSKTSLVLGFTTLKDQFTRVIMDYENPLDLKLLTTIGCMDGVIFNDNSINSSEELFICFKTKNRGYYGLIDYAKIVKRYNIKKKIKPIPIGWCSWYYYFREINQEEMIKNLEFFKNNKNNLPIDLIQLDDGYFKEIGDYNNINSKFPNGLPWLFEEIKKSEFQRGIWTAPFFGGRKSDLFKNHRDWFLKKSGKILKTHFSLDWQGFQFSLDLTNKNVLAYLRTFFSNLLYAFKNNQFTNMDFLVNYFKIDFLHAAVPLDAEYKFKNLTRAQLYHNGIRTIRNAITDKSFLLGCGAPLGPCVGLVDAMRISEDTAPIWEIEDTPEELKEIPVPALKEALLNILYRSFMHKYFWINDPDCLMIRRNDTKLNLDEIRLQMTIFGLSGGQILISDDMSKLSEEEINDAKLLLPPYNPKKYDPLLVDAFTSELPSIYMLQTKEVIGKRYLVALINWNNDFISKKLKILDLVPNFSTNDKKFYIFDFWNEKFLGEFKVNDSFEISEIEPHSCRYLNIIPINKKIEDLPVLISSNLHITQGCCEIKNFEYYQEFNQLEIGIELSGIREGFILLKLPHNRKIVKANIKYSYIDPKYNLWKVFIDFENKITLNIDLT